MINEHCLTIIGSITMIIEVSNVLLLDVGFGTSGVASGKRSGVVYPTGDVISSICQSTSFLSAKDTENR